MTTIHTDTTTLEEDDFIELREAREVIRRKILHTLKIWPKLSPSMLQVGIGTSLSSRMWHPVLDQLIREGKVIRTEQQAKSHIGRDQIYTIISLAPGVDD